MDLEKVRVECETAFNEAFKSIESPWRSEAKLKYRQNLDGLECHGHILAFKIGEIESGEYLKVCASSGKSAARKLNLLYDEQRKRGPVEITFLHDGGIRMQIDTAAPGTLAIVLRCYMDVGLTNIPAELETAT